MSPPASGGPPPLPPLPPRPAAPAAPPPRPRSNGCLIAVIVAAGLMVPVVAILAAIAVPAYQDYVARSKIGQALAETGPLKTQMTTFALANGRCPANGADGFAAADAYRGAWHASVTLGRTGAGACGLGILLRDDRGDAIDGRLLWLEFDPGSGDWRCSSDVDNRYLPAECRS